MRSLGKLGVWMMAALVLMSAAAMADDDPPSRVARLQYMSGQVSLQPGGVNDWVPGVLNRPLTTADRVWTDKESKAELDLGSAALRAGSETSVTLTNVSDNTIQVELDQGTLDLRVRRLYDGETYEIDTPNLAFTILRAGEYRLDVDPNSDMTVVTVWRGVGEATGEGRSVRIKGDRQARFTNGTSLEHQMTDDPDRDGFDDWCRVRNRRQDYSESARYVSPDVIGADDLDHYGRWQMSPEYGSVWVPAVAPGWAPYHYGHWAWIEPWGWTWVDDAPWGFAPFHYGRWVYDDGAWGWVPGPRVERPVYAPALVAWVGGGGVSIGIAVGEAPTVGWFPLGYGEPYLPPYSGSRNYFQQVNVSNTRITNITQVTNNYYVNNNNTTINRTTVVNNNTTNVVNNNNTTIVNNNVHNNIHNNVHIRYANENIPGAVTAVPATALAGSQPVAQAALRVPPGQWKREQVAVAPPVAPSRASVLGVRAGASAVAPPSRVMTRQVVIKTAPPPRPIPFAMKQEALQRNPGRPLDRDTEQAMRTRVARQQVNQPGRVAQQEPFGGRPGNTQPAGNQPQPRQQMQTDRGVRGVPQPPARQQVQEQPQAGRAVPHPPMNRAEDNREQMAPQYRQAPRPPQQGNGQPGSRSFGGTQEQSHPVAQPPAQENRQQPGFRSFESSQGQGHSVPRPPQNQGVTQPNNRGMDNAGPQPRSEGNRPSAAPQYDRGNQGSTAARPSSSRQDSQPQRVERSAPRPEPASSSGREAHSQPSPQHKEDSKDNNKDKQH